MITAHANQDYVGGRETEDPVELLWFRVKPDGTFVLLRGIQPNLILSGEGVVGGVDIKNEVIQLIKLCKLQVLVVGIIFLV